MRANMRLPSRYGLVAAGAGGGAICWWVSESRCLSASTYAAGSSRKWRGANVALEVWRQGGLSPWRSWRQKSPGAHGPWRLMPA